MSSTRPKQKPEPQLRAMKELKKSMARFEENKKSLHKDKDSTSTGSTSGSTHSTSSSCRSTITTTRSTPASTQHKAEKRKRDEQPDAESSNKKPKARVPFEDVNAEILETVNSTIGERAKARVAAKELRIRAARRTDGKGVAVKKRKSITSEEKQPLFDQSILDVGEAECSDDEDMTVTSAQPAKKLRARAKKQVEPPAVAKPAIVDHVVVKPTVVESALDKPSINNIRPQSGQQLPPKGPHAPNQGRKPEPTSKLHVTSSIQGMKRKVDDLDTPSVTMDVKKPRITPAGDPPSTKIDKQSVGNAAAKTSTILPKISTPPQKRTIATPKSRITASKPNPVALNVAPPTPAVPISASDSSSATESSNKADARTPSVVNPLSHQKAGLTTVEPLQGVKSKAEELEETQEVASQPTKKKLNYQEFLREYPQAFIKKEILETEEIPATEEMPEAEGSSPDNATTTDLETEDEQAGVQSPSTFRTLMWRAEYPMESIESAEDFSTKPIKQKGFKPGDLIPIYAQNARLDPNLSQEEKSWFSHEMSMQRDRARKAKKFGNGRVGEEEQIRTVPTPPTRQKAVPPSPTALRRLEEKRQRQTEEAIRRWGGLFAVHP